MKTVKQLDVEISALTRDVENLQRQAEEYALEVASGSGRGGPIPLGMAEANFAQVDRQMASKIEDRRRLQLARAAAERRETDDGDI